MSDMQLRDYQTRAIERMRGEYSKGHRRVCLVLPTGAGKTHTAAAACVAAIGRGRRVLWLAHRSELVDQAIDAFAAQGVTAGAIAAGSARREVREASVYCASVQTLLARNIRPEADLVVFDECFAAGTLVDGEPIEQIELGRLVSCVDHASGQVLQSRVKSKFSRISRDVWSVDVNGECITCTGNHPFFVKGKGYVPARNLVSGDLLCVRSDVCGDETEFGQGPQDVREVVYVDQVFGNYDAHQQGARKWTDEVEEPHDARGCQAKDGGNSAVNRPRSEGTRGQWENCNGTRSDAFAGAGMADASGGEHGQTSAGLSDQLQNRCGKPGPEGCYRSGRREPLLASAQGTGSKEGRFLVWSRVDGVSRDERASADGIRVYNLEVAIAHTYFANGVLVHNCHHAIADEFRVIPDAYPKAHILGLTATPERGDGRGLGDLFDSITVGVTCRELVQLGMLVHAEILAPSERLKANQIAQTPAQAYAKYAKGRPTVVFCRTVAEAVNHTAEFERDGVRAGYVTGAMANDVRRNVLARFKAGELDALCNVMVLTEGWDSPATSCAIIARSVGTTGLWLQMVGRVLRLSPGKSDALIIDLQGNSIEHGHPEDDYTFSLDGKGCRKGGADFPACPVCSAPMAGPACEECGFVREAWTDKPGSEVTGDELVKYARKLAEGADKRLETLKRWCQYAAARDYLPGWVYHKYKTVYKSEPSRIDVARFMAQWRAA